MALVSLAGPLSNLILAFIFAFFFHFFDHFRFSFLNLNISDPLVLMCYLGVKINIGLGIFNLLPIPPLDGSKILVKFLPLQLRIRYLRWEFLGFILIIILAVTGLLSLIIYPIISFFSKIIFFLTNPF